MTSPTPLEGEVTPAPEEELPPVGLLLRPLLDAEMVAWTEFREALLHQRVALSSRSGASITQAADLVNFQTQRLAQAVDHRNRRAIGLLFIPADTSIEALALTLEAQGDAETALQCRALRSVALLAAQDTAINRRIAEGQLGVSQGAIEAVREAVSRLPLGYDPHESAGPAPGAIITRLA